MAALLIAVDSDGCVFNNMTSKHCQAFGPAFIQVYGLVEHAQAVQRIWERINLFSAHRGVNRFKAVVLACDELARAGIPVKDPTGLRQWIASSAALSAQALAEQADDPDCLLAIAWSEEVNRRVVAMAPEEPIDGVRRALVAARGLGADIVVVSQAASSTLETEWQRCGLAELVSAIGGQEQGSKSDQLRWAMNTYRPQTTLMIGDAPGDRQAAETVGCLFYPIVPGEEEQSWRSLAEDGLQRLSEQTFAGDFQQQHITSFEAALAC